MPFWTKITVLSFQHLLEAHNLAEAVFNAVSSLYLQDRSLLILADDMMILGDKDNVSDASKRATQAKGIT